MRDSFTSVISVFLRSGSRVKEKKYNHNTSCVACPVSFEMPVWVLLVQERRNTRVSNYHIEVTTYTRWRNRWASWYRRHLIRRIGLNLFETAWPRRSKKNSRPIFRQKKIISLWPVHATASHVSDQPTDPIHKRLDQALGFILAIHATNWLRAHRRQDVVAGGQANEECKGNQPNAYAKVGRNHGKSRDVDMFVVGRSGVRSLLVIGEESEPHIVVEKDQD